MDVDDLKDRYKAVPVWGRCVAALILGVSPGLYFYIEEGEVLNQELMDLEIRVRTAENNLARRMSEKAQIPKLEQTLAFTEDQLEKAKKSLPDRVDVDELLQKVASVGREIGITLRNFEPQDSVAKTEGEVSFVEVPVVMEVEGSFAQIATYLDRLAHFETSIFVRDLSLGRLMANAEGAARGNAGPGEASVVSHAEAKAARKDMKISAKFRMVLFSSGPPIEPEPEVEDPASLPPEAKNPSARSETNL